MGTGSDNNSALRGRIAELEEQLAGANRAEKATEDTALGLRAALAYAKSIVDTVREPMLVLDGDLRVQTANRAFYQYIRRLS
jgi:two-component system CheB/CheR fusion protein